MEEEGNADYGGMVQPSQQHVSPCVKMVEWRFGTRGLRIVILAITMPVDQQVIGLDLENKEYCVPNNIAPYIPVLGLVSNIPRYFGLGYNGYKKTRSCTA